MDGEIRPEDLQGLTTAELVNAGQFMTLATLVKLSENPSVRQQALSALASTPAAFNWWWAASKHFAGSAGDWATASLPKPLVIPEDLQDDVHAFLTGSAEGLSQDPGRDNARVRLFSVLEPDHLFTRRVARDLLTGNTPVTALMEPALAVLGASREPADRLLVGEHADRGNRPDLATLTRLAPPLTEDESNAIEATLTQTLAGLPDNEREPATVLLARLEPATIAGLLLRFPNAQHAVLAHGLVGKIGTARTKDLVGALVGEPDAEFDETGLATLEARRGANAVLARINTLPDPDQLATALWVAKNHPELDLDPFVQHLHQQARPMRRITDGARAARAQLLQLLAAKPSEVIETAYSEVASLDDLSEWDLEHAPFEATWTLGRAYGRAVQATKLTITHVIEAATAFAEERGAAETAPFIGGLMDCLDDIPELAELAAGSPEGVAAAARARHAQQVIEAMQRAGVTTSDFVHAAVATSAALPIPTGSETGPTSDGVVRSFLDNIVPAQLTEADADRLATELDRRRPVLRAFCFDLMKTLIGPQASQVQPAALGRVLRAIHLNGDLAHWPIDRQADPLVAALVHVDDPEVLALTATWLGHSPASPISLALAVDAAEARIDPDNPFRAARASIADQFATDARNPANNTADRVRHLQDAQKADPTVARTAAFHLIADAPTVLRRAAAEVLATTAGASDEVTILEEAHTAEVDAVVRQSLAAALRRVQSGDVGEALHNLIHHFGLEAELDGLDARVALPYSDWHDAFIECVDEVRRSATSPVGAAVQAHLKLGELLVNQALGHAWSNDAGANRRKQGEDLLKNAPGKPAVGNLVNNQNLLTGYPWLHTYAALRSLRSVHPTPAGSTTPVVASETDRAVAHRLTRDVVHGWALALQEVRP